MSHAHELARRYNETLYATSPDRADEIEWFVDGIGNLRLRDIPEATKRRNVRTEQKREAERKRWAAEHHAEHRPFAPSDAGWGTDERFAL